MSETTTETVQTQQPQAEKTLYSGMDRLSQDPSWMEDDKAQTTTTTTTESTATQTETKPEVKPEDTTTKPEENKTEGEVKEGEKKEETAAATETKPEEDVWKLDETPQEDAKDGTWAGLIETLGYEVPKDFNEEKGFEVLQQLKEAEFKQKLEQSQTFDREQFLSQYPPEARLMMDLMAQGLKLEEINAPFIEIQQLKGMDDAALVRLSLERNEGWTPDMVDHKMNQLTQDGKLEIEAKILRTGLDTEEKRIKAQQTQQLEHYKTIQNQVKEQKHQQEVAGLKLALGRVQTFMDKKLTDDVKAKLLPELTSGKYDNMPGTHDEKVDYLLYSKFGKQAMKDYQARVQEKLILEKAKQQHNVPIVTNTQANRVDTTQNNGKSRLENDPRFRD